MYNSDDKKYNDYVCILSVVAQIAIDNAKRKSELNLETEIPYIQKQLDVDTMGLPYFWEITKKDKRKARSDKERNERNKKNKDKIRKKINKELKCPMNYIYDLKFDINRSQDTTLPMSYFFIKHEQDEHHRKSKKVEDLIQKYSIELHNIVMSHDGTSWKEDDDLYLLLNDFDNLISDIKKIYISRNYLGLMSWLINRAFCINSGVKRNKGNMNSNTDKNKSLLLKVLYTINSEMFLKCFKSGGLNDANV